MPTITPTPEEMESRIMRFGNLVPKKTRYDGIPPEAFEAIAANTIYQYLAPEGDGGSYKNHPGVRSLDGLTINLCRCPPGDGPALHAHDRSIETFMCMKGTFEIRWGDQGEHATMLEELDLISLPMKVMRKFRNTGTEDALLLVLIQGANEDVGADVQYAPETGERIAERFGQDVRERIENMGWRFDAELGSLAKS